MEATLQNMKWVMDVIFIVLLSFIYWCVDEKKCLRIGTVVLFSVWLNLVLKHVLDLHHPTDVIVALLIVGLLLGLYFLFAKRIETLLEAVSTRVGGTRAGLISAAALSFIMILYRPAAEIIIPAGMILGLAAGHFLNSRSKNFTTEYTEKTKETIKTLCSSVVEYSFWTAPKISRHLTLAGRFVLGMAGFALLYYATGILNNIFNNSENYDLFVFLRYALLALWISAGAPWLFRFTRLADKPR